jgi:putative CocE/NonD family hydrolase
LSGPSPCIFMLTPYVSDSYHESGVYFAAHGFPFLIVDVRGRGNSEGVFRPFIQEAHDGYDVVEWLAQQPYCNGKIAMWGGSYSGYDQWATAKEFPPHLRTIVPAASSFVGLDFPKRNNIFYPGVMQWITSTSGHTAQDHIDADDDFWRSTYRSWFESGRQFRDLDTLLGNPSPVFQEWLAHPALDAYWDAYNPTAEQYANLAIPILTITGAYDDDQPGALEDYANYLRNASASARERHYLIIGPWDHAGTRTPKREFGGLSFGEASLVDLPKVHLAWYRWTMQDGPQPEFLKKKVAYYVMGAERWRYADTLEGVTSRFQKWFLDSSSPVTDVFSSGSLGTSAGKGRPNRYRYDPAQVDGPEVNAEAHVDGGSIIDQTVTLALAGKELIYQSVPFGADTEVSGFFRFSAWLAIDRPDTDFYVSIYDIGLDGRSIRLSTDVMRARYSEGLRTPRLIDTRAPLRYDFHRFTFVSREIKQGHRLRLVIAPMGARFIYTNFAEKNYNSGRSVAEDSIEHANPVTVSLYHDRGHPSVLYVPFGQPQ